MRVFVDVLSIAVAASPRCSFCTGTHCRFWSSSSGGAAGADRHSCLIKGPRLKLLSDARVRLWNPCSHVRNESGWLLGSRTWDPWHHCRQNIPSKWQFLSWLCADGDSKGMSVCLWLWDDCWHRRNVNIEEIYITKHNHRAAQKTQYWISSTFKVYVGDDLFNKIHHFKWRLIFLMYLSI